jgi:predicted RNase H-like HicB family nuclease
LQIGLWGFTEIGRTALDRRGQEIGRVIADGLNKAVNPSGGSGVFKDQRFLASAGLPWSLAAKSVSPRTSLEVILMKAEFTAIVKKDGDWWIGWVEEIPGANAQEKTKEELILSLREAVKDILELRCQEARAQAQNDFEEIPLSI